MLDFDALSRTMRGRTVLCIGDVMLDEFVYGEVSRISPEAPTPVLLARRSEVHVGGAGNVARNIAGLGARCIFVGVIGEDDAGNTIEKALMEEDGVESLLVRDSTRPTTRKMRFVSEHFSTHMLRADWEIAQSVTGDAEERLISSILSRVAEADVVLLSDYAKGALSMGVIRCAIAAARDRGIPVVVDPKNSDFGVYAGATLLTPNRKEFSEAARHGTGEMRRDADALLRAADCGAILVTQSEAGMTLFRPDLEPFHVPALPVKVRDVSGAGDTVVATIAVTLAAGAAWEAALRMAVAAAAVAVGKRGTATVDMSELRSRILPQAYLASEVKIQVHDASFHAKLAEWRRDDLRIGFTNGCFDIIHPGHVKLLTAARAACDRLIVGLNTDASVRRLKGETRPVQTEMARADVLAALEAVDAVVFFDDDTPIDLIEFIKPDVLIKGSDYAIDQIVGGAFVTASGGEVVLVEVVPGMSTTSLVAKARGVSVVDDAVPA